MAITIDWITKIISVPKADMTMLSATLYELDLDVFRLTLKAIESSEEGMPFVDIHKHRSTITVGGTVLARSVEIINGYTVTFEPGIYAVNAVGANSNVSDVMNLNGVSLRTFNTAGLVVTKELNVTKQTIRDAMALATTEIGAAGSLDEMIIALYRILGLDASRPLVVAATQRTAGSEITQSVDEASGITTVTRQP